MPRIATGRQAETFHWLARRQQRGFHGFSHIQRADLLALVLGLQDSGLLQRLAALGADGFVGADFVLSAMASAACWRQLFGNSVSVVMIRSSMGTARQQAAAQGCKPDIQAVRAMCAEGS